MEKVIINSYEDFEKLVGQQIGVSEYVELPQERINLFADATSTISGYTSIRNVPKWKALLRAPLHMGISPCPCCHICGTRLLK